MVTLLGYNGVFSPIMYHHYIATGTCIFVVIFVDCHLIHKGQDSLIFCCYHLKNTGSLALSSGVLEEQLLSSVDIVFFFKKINYSKPITGRNVSFSWVSAVNPEAGRVSSLTTFQCSYFTGTKAAPTKPLFLVFLINK